MDRTAALQSLYKVELEDQNFKGDALEQLVRADGWVLPPKGCEGLDGQERQVDASFAVGDTLVIVECRAFAKSFGFERGDPRAIAHRSDKIDAALRVIDEKARWLAVRPTGGNYDISAFSYILPLVITPFAEFIPTLAPSYWLNDALPRVMTPQELRDALASGALRQASLNAWPIEKGCAP